MFETETARKIKKAPALNRPLSKAELPFMFPLQDQLRSAEETELADLAMEGKGDVVTQMWRF